MKTNKALLCLILFFMSILSWGQTQSIEIVKKNYPQIYTSIVQEADSQWGNDERTKLSIIDGQAKAFLYFAESNETIDNEAMTQAIINSSLPGAKNYNTEIINDLSIADPFPLLKCDWYKVKASYERSVRPSSDYTSPYSAGRRNRAESYDRDINRNRSVRDDDYYYQRRNERRDRNKSSYYDESLSSKSATKSFDIGVNIRTGVATLLNLDYFDTYPGYSIEGGLSLINRFDGGLFIQNDLNISYARMGIEYSGYYYDEYYDDYYYDNYYYSSYEVDLFRASLLNTFYFGFYKNINSNVRLLGGLGAFGQWIFDSGFVDGGEGNDYLNYKKFNFGVAALFGVEVNKFQFGIYPKLSLGSSKVSLGEYEYGDYYEVPIINSGAKTLTINLGATYWF